MAATRTVVLALLASVACASPITKSSDDFELRILHTNDMHARFEQTSRMSGTCSKPEAGCYGGFARVAHIVRTAKEQAGPPVLFLNAGDTYTGTVWFTVHRYKIVTDFLNALNPDVMSLGNHEFDDGVSGLLPFINNSTSPIVAANLNFEKEPLLAASKIVPSFILNVSDHQIGVIGYLTPDTKVLASPGEVIFMDEVESIKRESEKLNAKGVKILIALGHSGFYTDKQIAEKVPLIDLVIGGHTNTFLYNGPAPDLETPEGPYPTVIKQPSGKKVPVVQAYAYTKYIGNLTVTFNSNGDLTSFHGQPILIDSKFPQDKDFLEKLELYRPEVEKMNHQVIGKTSVVLEGGAENCRKQECNLGNLMADAISAYYSTKQYVGECWTDAPIVLFNGGGIRTSIDATDVDGNITVSDLLAVIPFDNQIVAMTVSGAVLKQIFEHSVLKFEKEPSGGFLQVSGVNVTYDLSKPVGKRVVELELRCSCCDDRALEPFDVQHNYRILVPSFIANGGDGYSMLTKGKNKISSDFHDAEIVSWYIQENSPVHPIVENRINFGTGKSPSNVIYVNTYLFFIVCVVTFYNWH